jgi:hypothetical protein
VNTNIPTTHSCPPITPNDRYVLITRVGPCPFLSFLFDHARCPPLHEGHALFKASLAKALAVEKGKLRTWRFSRQSRITPTSVFYSHTQDSSPTRTTIATKTNQKYSHQQYALNGGTWGLFTRNVSQLSSRKGDKYVRTHPRTVHAR